jgi:hypothetical protein
MVSVSLNLCCLKTSRCASSCSVPGTSGIIIDSKLNNLYYKKEIRQPLFVQIFWLW